MPSPISGGPDGKPRHPSHRIVRSLAHKAWVSCLLEFKTIKRSKQFFNGNYSELFFVDEATAFAAGHRPCAYCQRARHLEFEGAWVRANVPEGLRASTKMPDIDKSFTLSARFPVVAKGRTMRGQLRCLKV